MAMNDKNALEILILSATNEALSKAQAERTQVGMEKAKQYGLKL